MTLLGAGLVATFGGRWTHATALLGLMLGFLDAGGFIVGSVNLSFTGTASSGFCQPVVFWQLGVGGEGRNRTVCYAADISPLRAPAKAQKLCQVRCSFRHGRYPVSLPILQSLIAHTQVEGANPLIHPQFSSALADTVPEIMFGGNMSVSF